MDRVIAANSVPSSGADAAPATGTPQFFTSGNPATATPATVLPAYFMNAIQEEIRNAIVAAGLTPDRTNNAQLLAAIQTIGGISRGAQVFTSAGTFTVPGGITKVKVTLVGGGSGGSGAAGGGGQPWAGTCGAGGGWAIGFYPVTPGQQIPVTVGAGGAGVGPTGLSGSGGSSSFGSFCSATGGGQTGYQQPGGIGGTGTGGLINGSGDDGADGTNQAPGNGFWTGISGASLFGGSRHCVQGGPGFPGSGPGAGGSAPYSPGSSNSVGGNGAAGLVLVEW